MYSVEVTYAAIGSIIGGTVVLLIFGLTAVVLTCFCYKTSNLILIPHLHVF